MLRPERGASEVRVQDNAGCVNDESQRWRPKPGETTPNLRLEWKRLRARPQRLPGVIKGAPDLRDDQMARILSIEREELSQRLIHGGKVTKFDFRQT